MTSLSDPNVDGLIKLRNKCRDERNFIEADRIRNRLAMRGIFLRDDGDSWVASKAQHTVPRKCRRWVHRRKDYCNSLLATTSSVGSQQTEDEDISEYFFCPECRSKLELLGRCPCPFDERHSCLLTKMPSHLRLCQSKPGVSFLKTGEKKQAEQVVAMLPSNRHNLLLSAGVTQADISTGMRDIKLLHALSERMASAFDEIFGTHLKKDIFGAAHDEGDVAQLSDNIRSLFDSLPPIPMEANIDSSVEKEIVGRTASKAKRKHSVQQASISEHLNQLWLPNGVGVRSRKRVAIVEFCSGKGRLSKMILDIANFRRERKGGCGEGFAHGNGIEFSPIVLIDRTEARHDALNSPTIAQSEHVKSIRLNSDISNVNLSSVELLHESKHISAVGKHLCGVATDLSLKCYCAGLQRYPGTSCLHGPIGSVTFAMCCHHLCCFDQYVNVGLLQRHGIERGEFLLLKRLVTKYRCHPNETQTVAAKLAGAKAQMGVMGKRLLNEGRKVWLKGNSVVLDDSGLQCGWKKVRLVRYVAEEVSPENTLLVGLAVVR